MKYFLRYVRILHSFFINNSKYGKRELYHSDLFSIEFWDFDADIAHMLIVYMEKQRAKISKELEIESNHKITIQLYKSKSEFDEMLKKKYLTVPNWVIGHADGTSLVSLVSPLSIGMILRFNGFNQMMKVAVHEMVHCLLQVASSGTNLVRWLDEGVALHFAEQNSGNRRAVMIGDINKINLEELSKKHSKEIYHIGNRIISFILENWGMEAINALIKNNGDIEGALEMEQEEFEEQFKIYLKRGRQNYA